jgi:hypothetical protein
MENYLNVKWKTAECNSKDCWCRLIVPVSECDAEYIIPDGSVDKETAEHIVKLHNDKIDADSLPNGK